MNKKIAILLASYNGEKFIGEQLDSILTQTCTDWVLYIRDDGSTDSTVEIIQQYSKKNNRIKLVQDDLGNLRQCMNFNALIDYAIRNENVQYYMFSDQDDVWLECKLEKMMQIADSAIAQNDRDLPVLLYSNYYNFYQGIDKQSLVYKEPFNYTSDEYAARLLMQNWVMGCTTLVNRKLLEISYPIPTQAENHDNWIANLAALSGTIHYIHEPLIWHRIHESNVTTSLSTGGFFKRILRTLKRIRESKAYLGNKHIFAEKLRETLIASDDAYKQELLDDFKKLLVSRAREGEKIMSQWGFSMVNDTQNKIFKMQLNKNKRK